MPSYYPHGTAAVKCPVCKSVFSMQGIWVHITGRAKGEAIRFEKTPHLDWLREKRLKKQVVVKVQYSYQFKPIHSDYYKWRMEQRVKRDAKS